MGNPRAISDLKRWAQSWNEGTPKFRTAVLLGSSGIGKTTSVFALANDMGWGVLEMNASDQCTNDTIKNVILRGAYSDTFDDNGTFLRVSEKRRKLIVLDEADSLSEKSDRGTLNAITELIKNAKQPVILIVNDFYMLKKRISAVTSGVFQIRFIRLSKITIVRILGKICASENIQVEEGTLECISENSNGDVRAAIMNLESLVIGKTRISLEDARQLSERTAEKDIYALMSCVFRSHDAIKARNMLKNVSEEPGFISRWMDENVPYEYVDAKDLKNGYEMLSRADIYLRRASRRQYYGMWSYAKDMMTAGVCSARTSDYCSHNSFTFPGKTSDRFKDVRLTRISLCTKLSKIMHMSAKKISQDVISLLKIMVQNDPNVRTILVKDAALEQKELMFLMDGKTSYNMNMKNRILKPDLVQTGGIDTSTVCEATSRRKLGGGLKSGVEQTTLF